MYRAVTKCSLCNDLLWFRDIDPTPQSVQCPCGATKLEESGPTGEFTTPTQEELDTINDS